MKRRTLTNFGRISLAPLLAAGAVLCVSRAMAQPVISNAANGSSSAAFWYLNGLPSCCSDSPNGAIYYTQWQLNVYIPPGGSGTPVWSTDSPLLVSIAPAANGLSAILTAQGPSNTIAQGQATYNIHIYVTENGVQSAPFPVYINTPFSFAITSSGQYCNSNGDCDCKAAGLNGYTGYITASYDQGYDILGNALVPIDFHETIENQQFVAPGWKGKVGSPTASGWAATQWQPGNLWIDFYTLCGTGVLNPPATSSGNGTTAGFTETQKFWIGTTTTNFTGSCIDRNATTFYTDHGASSNLQTPGIPASICNQGQFAN